MHATTLLTTTLLTLAASAAIVTRAPLRPQSRQIGGIACNVARIKVVSALGDAGDAIAQIQDPAVQTAAQDGLDQANGGVDAIKATIVAGETASADGRLAVEAGLAAMADALAAGDA